MWGLRRTRDGDGTMNSGDDERGKLQPLGWRTPSTWLLLDLRSCAS
jgi:hypothetical protein